MYTQDEDTISIYKDINALVESEFRILFYTGDMDLICPPLQVAFGAGRIARNSKMMYSSAGSIWQYLGDFGGARTSYTTWDGRFSMDVITVRGAGHSVPISRPDRVFQLINNFIMYEPGRNIDYSKMIPRR
ncbi:hypothetical protein PENTCL1PPCAC_5169 [Pristionchus entomophagus]|uniref:Peptidase n=1 Tax=Pristionchus entomophagus TaxID=358040 RepID=A0AAV5SNU9_9BILA|nr:hypothetical protein PENTCL1PPCAC_5169 [Pristionchus entomophagus]